MNNKSMYVVLGAALAAGSLSVACSDPTAAAAPAPALSDLTTSGTGPTSMFTRAAVTTAPAGSGTSSCAMVVDARATQSLTSMARTLSGAQTILFSAMSTTEDVSSTLQKLQFDTSIHGMIRRPNLAFVEKTGAENTSIWFDGSTLTILDRNVNTFVRVGVNGNLDAMLSKLEELHVDVPFGGLLSSDLQQKVAEYAYQADYYAPTVINDRPSHHLALRQANVDWQLWTDMEKNTPTKIVITSKMLAGAPNHELLIRELRLDAPMEGTSFRAVLPAGAREVSANQ